MYKYWSSGTFIGLRIIIQFAQAPEAVGNILWKYFWKNIALAIPLRIPDMEWKTSFIFYPYILAFCFSERMIPYW